MRQRRFLDLAFALVLGLSLVCPTELQANDDQLSAETITFFENKIRPLLVNHCLECHGAEDPQNGLRLDSRSAILRGGESGQAGAIPGDPAKSLIVQSVRYASDFEMPPTEPLEKQQIADLSHWIELGMPWPNPNREISTASVPERIVQHRQSHWSFQPVTKPILPTGNQNDSSPIDQLLMASLNKNGIGFSEPADRRTLIRRASYDLTGLPPTYEEVTTFINDSSTDAYQRLIDRLLESPHYGERWARHWLDVARYADTRGYTLNNADRNYPFAFTYRDYVIDAFNQDLPYDQFIREQLAADYLELPPDKHTLAALGFLTVGRKYLARPDTIDDQIDVVTRGLMGLTVSCARCHDHKFDGIPTEDYYSLYGVFENCHEPKELPLIGDASQIPDFESFFDELKAKKNALSTYENEFHQRLQIQMDHHLCDYLTRAIAPDDEAAILDLPPVKLNQTDLNQMAIQKWQSYLAERANADHPALMPLGALFALPNENFAEHANKLIRHWEEQEDQAGINSLVMEALIANPPRIKAEIGQVYGNLLNRLREEWNQNGSRRPALEQFSGPEKEVAQILFGPKSPAQIKRDKIADYFNVAEKKEWDKFQSAINEHHTKTPVGVARAMTIRENESPHNERVMIRGNVNRRGAEVPRQFVALLSPDHRKPFQNRAGRLELANAIASPDNPLTARVLVNRVWMHHFNKPLVDTPSDFGIQCPPPVQRQLLDFLAADFMEHGWSIKRLHRSIMLSQAYRQRSVDRPACVAIDPENRLLWKMNRRRLEFEALRDSMLAVAENLDSTLHGRAVDLFRPPGSQRRTIYGKIDRQDLPNLLRVFDLANPDQSTSQRIRTTVPQQSLFMMNHNFSVHQARILANVIDRVSHDDPQTIQRKRIEKLYQTVFQRNPTNHEIVVAQDFLKSSHKNEGQLHPWQQFAQVLLWTNEFEFID